jgi:ATP-dependent helicase/nuclease subunit B
MTDRRQGDLFAGSGGEARRPAKVFNVAAGHPFADVLAAGIIDRYGASPGLSRVRVLLPTRRAVRALRDAFLRQTGGKPVLLPHIRPIGDVDEEELTLDQLVAGAFDEAESIVAGTPPPVPAVLRQLLLTAIVVTWSRRNAAAPGVPGHAARLAQDLAGLIDQVQTEGVSFERLRNLVPDELAEHWARTLEFLKIVTHEWPGVLKTQGYIDPAEYRNRMLAALARHWSEHPPTDPVIAAGSTGSIPASAALLGVVAQLPAGAVVLPGLDQFMEDEAWQAIGQTHPQFGMKQLLERMEVARGDVATWQPGAQLRNPERTVLLSEVMRPAPATGRWHMAQLSIADALRGLIRIECPGPREEAGVIALLMREALETPGKTAAMVTADRALARRVAAELQRWNLDVDDTAGIRLSETPAGAFLRLTAAMIAEDLAPISLLSALKHPLAAGGQVPGAFRAQARQLELAVLRGPRPGSGFRDLQVALLRKGDSTESLRAWLRRIEREAKPLQAALKKKNASLEELAGAHLEFAESLAASDEETGAARLWRGEAGEALADLFREILEGAIALPALGGAEYPDLLETLMAQRVVRPRFGAHPRLAIWGPLEARLQHADLLILGGLNEGKWPPDAGPDPWLSRPMRQRFGLPLPERRIGLAAHDFVQGACAPEVVLTRAVKIEGTPTVASRWLLRLEMLVGQPQQEEEARAARYLEWARTLDWDGLAKPVAPPNFAPPIEARPRELSVTDIELLVRNPYGVFAKKILGLRLLDPIDAAPGAADRGSFIHQALDAFVTAYPGELPENALEELHAFGKKAFGDSLDEPMVAAFWWPWFEQIAEWFVGLEQGRRRDTVTIASEAKGRWTFEAPRGPFTLTAKADRIDRLPDGTLAIVDYKTGMVPRQEDVRFGLSPQLPVEAVIAEAGGFEGVDAATVGELAHWKLGGVAAGKLQPVRTDEKEGGLAALIDAARAGVVALVARFDDPATPYLCRPRPSAAPRFDDYEHLARFKEWAAEGEVET